MTTRMNHIARYIFCVSLYYSGIFFLIRSIRRMLGIRRVVILTYHCFSDSIRYLDMAVSPSLFMEQVRYLRNSFKALTLSDALALHDAAARVPDDLAVITVDDGYADNFQPLVEAATKYGVPATVYLTTDCIDEGQPTTVMWLMLAIHHATTESIDLPEIGAGSISIRTPIEKESAIQEIDTAVRLLPESRRSAIIERVLERSGAQAVVRQRAESAMLQWEQVRQMHGAGIEFGAHSLSHPVLGSLDASAVRDEIIGSIQRVREMVGVETVTFAYPYGSHAEVSEAVIEICRGSGASGAVMQVDGEMPGRDPFRIPRTMVTSDRSTTPWGEFSRAVWACELEGLLDPVRSLKASISGHRENGGSPAQAVVSRKINILFAIDTLRSVGGTEKHLSQLTRLLPRDAFECSVVAFDLFPNSLIDDMRAAGVQVHDVPVRRIYAPNALRRAKELGGIIKRNKVDIVQTYHQTSDTFAAVVAKLCGVKRIISSKRDTGYLKRPIHVFLNRRLKSLFDRTIVVSDAVAEAIVATEGIDRSRIVKIYNGVDAKRFSPPNAGEAAEVRASLGFAASDFVVGTAAIFRPEKNYDIFFEGALKAMRSIPSLKILALGDGPLFEHFRALYDSEAARSRIVFAGAVKDVDRYLKAMDVGCLLSTEGFSNAVLEKMATGLPMIVSGVGGSPEAVIDGENGLVIPPPLDAEAFCAALVRLHGDSAKRLAMGRRSRQLVEERYSLRDMCKSHAMLYASLMTQRRC